MFVRYIPLITAGRGIRASALRRAQNFSRLGKHCRYNSSITPANSTLEEQTTNLIKEEGQNINSATISDLLNEYKGWFPMDEVTISQINTYLDIGEDQTQRIRIGLIYDNEGIAKKSKIVESLLADPLSSNNEIWLNKIINRSRQENNKFDYSNELTDKESAAKTNFRVPSPILSSDYRPKYTMEGVSQSNNILNDIELWELNDTSKIVDCHFYINVTNDLAGTIQHYSKSFQKKILLTVVDNTEYSPTSIEATPISFTTENTQHIIKINSSLSFKGIVEFIKYDTKAATEFLDSLKNSNIYELFKFIGLYSRLDVLNKWLLMSIYSNMSNYNVSLELIKHLYETIKTKDISEFVESVHSELQYKFIPETTDFFGRKLRWWKLYLKNDNVEYDLKDFFNKSFMKNSIEHYNYLRGQIVSKLQQQRFGNYSAIHEFNNPLSTMKEHLINQRITNEIQPIVYSSLATAFVYYQLPVSVISFLSYQYFEFSSNSAIALSLLGWVIGFNHVSKNWENFTKSWLNELFEDVRLCLGKQCIDKGLLKELNSRYEEEIKLAKIKNKILEGIADK